MFDLVQGILFENGNGRVFSAAVCTASRTSLLGNITYHKVKLYFACMLDKIHDIKSNQEHHMSVCLPFHSAFKAPHSCGV